MAWGWWLEMTERSWKNDLFQAEFHYSYNSKSRGNYRWAFLFFLFFFFFFLIIGSGQSLITCPGFLQLMHLTRFSFFSSTTESYELYDWLTKGPSRNCWRWICSSSLNSADPDSEIWKDGAGDDYWHGEYPSTSNSAPSSLVSSE